MAPTELLRFRRQPSTLNSFAGHSLVTPSCRAVASAKVEALCVGGSLVTSGKLLHSHSLVLPSANPCASADERELREFACANLACSRIRRRILCFSRATIRLYVHLREVSRRE
jgi:hypothetical protein